MFVTQQMLHRFYILFQPLPVAVTVSFALICIGVGELLADSVQITGYDDVTHLPGVAFAIRSRPLPNDWVWYSGDAIVDALKRQGRNITPTIIVTIYNAAINTAVVCVALVMITMFLALRSFSRQSLAMWCWLLPVVGFVFDVSEDVALLIIALGWPLVQYPALMEATSYCSLLKYASWLGTLVFWLICLVRMSLGMNVKNADNDE